MTSFSYIFGMLNHSKISNLCIFSVIHECNRFFKIMTFKPWELQDEMFAGTHKHTLVFLLNI